MNSGKTPTSKLSRSKPGEEGENWELRKMDDHRQDWNRKKVDISGSTGGARGNVRKAIAKKEGSRPDTDGKAR